VNDDSELIAKTLDGDSAAFGRLVLKYQDRLYNTVMHVCGNAEDARDVVQNAFVQSYVKLKTFKGTSAFYTWLYRIAFNEAINIKRKKRPTLSADRARETSGIEPEDDQAGPHEKMEVDERRRQVREAIGTLNDEHRSVLVLREIDGCSYETIAEILDLPVGTVRSRLHRARLQLREELKEVLAINE